MHEEVIELKKTNIIFTFLLLIFLVLQISAAAETGSGDGSGGGSGDPLTLSSSSVPDGSTNVALDTEITLTFSKNVVNAVVKAGNMSCFTLTDTNGAVPIKVIMGDDQTDPAIKRIIKVAPSDKLSPGSKYILTVSKALTAKSGSTLQSDISISFTTAGSAATQTPSETAAAAISPAVSVQINSPAALKEEKNKTISPSIAPSPDTSAAITSPDAAAAEQSASAEEQSPSPSNAAYDGAKNQSNHVIWYITIALLLPAVAIYPVIKRKRRR